MRLDKGEQITKTPLQSSSLDRFAAAHLEQVSRESKTTHSLPEGHSLPRADYFAIVARATNDAIRDWDVKSGALCWPQGLDSLLGYDGSSIECDIGFWQKNVHPGDCARIAPSIRDALAGSSDHWSGEYRFRRGDGTYINLLERLLILRAADGTPERLIGSLMDVTARKQLQDQLCRSQKMEAFGQLAGGVAHDFNNFLTTILGYSDLVLAEKGMKGTLANHVAEIRNAAGRASVLTGQLFAFSRRQALESRVVEANSLIANLERSVLRLIGENIQIISHLHDQKDSGCIKVDPGKLTQIILNLAVNARDAMPNGGQLRLETAIVDLSDATEPAFLCGEYARSEYVLISIADTGLGMSNEVKAHLFEPCFTTKDHGSGLALATSYGIVHEGGGHSRIESQVGN